MAGRKPIEFDEEQQGVIKRLAEINCTQQEIAHVMGVSIDVIKKPENRELIEQGKSLGKIKLRRAQYRNAIDDNNTTMQIWLGKQLLGQSDTPVNTDDNIILPWEE